MAPRASPRKSTPASPRKAPPPSSPLKSSKLVEFCAWTVVLVALALGGLESNRRSYAARLPANETNTHQVLTNIWTPEELRKIRIGLQKLGATEGIKNGDSYGYGRWPLTEHIGEAEPLGEDGRCANRYLVPNQRQPADKCILHHRMDVGLNYVMTGGRAELNNDPELLATRSSVFFMPVYKAELSTGGRFQDNQGADVFTSLSRDFPELQALFRKKELEPAVRSVCGASHGVLGQIFQVAFVVNVPGQQLATHYDIPFFVGANRYTLPHWLIVAMSASGLWEDSRIHQIQGVAYVHDWSHPTHGAFHFYPKGPGGDVVTVAANSSTATIIDGSVVQHGVDSFRPDAPTPPFTRHQATTLRFVGEAGAERGEDDGHWELLADGEPVAQYKTDDLRLSFVWRHMCFRSEEEQRRYQTEALTLEQVLDTFEADLRRRGVLAAGAPRPAPLDFGRLIIDKYVLYPPRRGGGLPYNPCVLAKAPAPIGPLVQTLCRAFAR